MDDRTLRGTRGGAPTHGSGAGRGRRPPRGRPVPQAPQPERFRYSMADLERETGFNARTIRYYITQGLLPPAYGRGPSATYDLGHLLRLQAIQSLKSDYLPLEEIKTRLSSLSDDDIARMFKVETSPPEYRWRRIELHPDIELHVREQEGKEPDRALERAVDRIVRLAQVEIDELEDSR